MRLLLFVPAILVLTVAACIRRAPPPGHDEAVTGTVTYRERLALPPGALLRVQLLDIDAPDVPDFIVAASERPIEGQVPLEFSVVYDPHALHEDVQYGVAAEILLEEKTWFETPEPVPVLTKGHPARADLVLRRVP